MRGYQDRLVEVFNGLQVPIFSKVDIEGYKSNGGAADISNWFAAGKVSDFSTMFFSFLTEDVADTVLNSIEKWNKKNEMESPMHAYVMDVNKSV
jgi:hypothetical protein